MGKRVTDRFIEALQIGPRSAADMMTEILLHRASAEAGVFAIEWILDLYERRLNEPERACFRDAVFLTIEGKNGTATTEIVPAVELARGIGLLTVAGSRGEERLLSAAYEFIDAGLYSTAGTILIHLAEAGARRTIDDWSAIYEHCSHPAITGACFEGILRHGVDNALIWIDELVSDGQLWDELFAEYLPGMIATDPLKIDRALGEVRNPIFRAALYSAFARYELAIERDPMQVEASHMITGVLSTEQEALLADFDDIESNASSTLSALEAYQEGDTESLPAYVIDLMNSGPTAAEWISDELR